MTGDPSRDEVISWLAERPNRTAEDAVNRWWPFATDRARRLALIRKWVSRGRRAAAKAAQTEEDDGDTDASDTADTAPASEPTRPEADLEHARLDRAQFWEWHLAELLTDMKVARQSGQIRLIHSLAAQVSDAREQLDTAKVEAGQVVNLDRNLGAVAEESLRRQKALEIYSAAEAAKAGASAPKLKNL